MDCGVCTSQYTEKARKQIQCNYCNEVACRQCYTTYLLTKTNPQCMFCNAIWDKDRLYTLFGKTFTIQIEKNMVENIFQLEKSLIPYSLAKIEKENRLKKYRLLSKEVERLTFDIENNNNRILELELSTKVHQCIIGEIKEHDEIDRVKERVATLGRLPREVSQSDKRLFDYCKFVKVTKMGSKNHQKIISSLSFEIYKEKRSVTEKQKMLEEKFAVLDEFSDIQAETEVLSMPCGVVSCKGFCNKQNSCLICGETTCSECREIVKQGHVCDKDLVKTIKLLEKQSKACPSCKVRISKIDGCNQMFCTNCNTAFNWETGQIENGRIHNPHYFDWLKRNGGQDIRQLAQPLECDDPTQISSKIYVIMSKIEDENVKTVLDDFVKCIELHNYIHDRLRVPVRYNDPKERFHDIRMWVIVYKPDDAKWKNELYKQYRKHEWKLKLNNLLQMFKDVALDILRKLQLKLDIQSVSFIEDINSCRSEITALEKYFNDESTKISTYYGYKHRYEINNLSLNEKVYNSVEPSLKIDDILTTIMSPPDECNKFEKEALKLLSDAVEEIGDNYEGILSYLNNSAKRLQTRLTEIKKRCRMNNKRLDCILKAERYFTIQMLNYFLSEPEKAMTHQVGPYRFTGIKAWWFAFYFDVIDSDNIVKVKLCSIRDDFSLLRSHTVQVTDTTLDTTEDSNIDECIRSTDALCYLLLLKPDVETCLNIVDFLEKFKLFNKYFRVPEQIKDRVREIVQPFSRETNSLQRGLIATQSKIQKILNATIPNENIWH